MTPLGTYDPALTSAQRSILRVKCDRLGAPAAYRVIDGAAVLTYRSAVLTVRADGSSIERMI
jgi:hypothetical protein